jgi:hypothetical protein
LLQLGITPKNILYSGQIPGALLQIARQQAVGLMAVGRNVIDEGDVVLGVAVSDVAMLQPPAPP